MYKVYNTNNNFTVYQSEIGKWIPMDESNTDYQQYLQWLAEGNEPEIIEP